MRARPDPESLFPSSSLMRNAGCCSVGGMGGGLTMTALHADETGLLALGSLRDGGSGMGGAAGTVDSYLKATKELSLKALRT